MGGIGSRFRAGVGNVNAVLAVLGWFGWKGPVLSFLTGLGGGAWALIEGVPLSIAAIAAVCLFTAALYLVKLPALYRLLAAPPRGPRPNYEIWRHTPVFHIRQAAFLFAEIEPKSSLTSEALGWAHNLALAVEDGELPPQSGEAPGQVSFDTRVKRDDLKKYADKRGIKPRFLYPD